MSKGRPTDYYVLYTKDGETKEELSTIKPLIIYDVMVNRRTETLYLDMYRCDLIAETESVSAQHTFTLDEVEFMERDRIKNLVKGLLSHDEIEQLKSWF